MIALALILVGGIGVAIGLVGGAPWVAWPAAILLLVGLVLNHEDHIRKPAR